MTAMNEDELREDLVATIEAATELPKESRAHLADLFLDRLNEGYDLMPRGTGKSTRPTGVPRSGAGRGVGAPPWFPGRGWGAPIWVKVALVLAFLVLVVPAIVHAFPIVLLIAVVVFFATRRARSHRSWTAMPR